jgi:hypothetical protein
MSSHLDFRRGRAALVAIAVCFAFTAIPVAAKAAAVNLGTAQPFVVLSGAGVTNTGKSVLNGELGVSPGTSLSGFPPGLVNGATHNNDAVAAQAQADLTTAYNVTAAQPVPAGNDLTGTNLGERTLSPGAYGFSSSAQLTGQLTLDAHGDPNAQFVFVIGEALTTASASSVILVNGASPCNVYWKVGSSATLGSTTAFEGNLMALTTISLDSEATVLGRVLARNGEVTLIEDTLTLPQCPTESTPTATEAASGGSGGSGTTPTATTVKKKTPKKRTTKGSATLTHGKLSAAGVTAGVHGKRIAKVTFTDNGSRVGGPKSPHKVTVPGTPGLHTVKVRVTFKDSTKTKTFTFHFRVPVPVLHPPTGPSQFTG